MPELPEVETVVRQIGPRVVGCTIASLAVSWPRTLTGGTRAAVERALAGRCITNVRRRAKWIVLEVEGGGALLVHLRMTGRLFVRASADSASAHRRVALSFTNATRLDFEDVRKFGRVKWCTDPGAALGDLGPEPLDDDFTARALHAALSGRRRSLKPLLLDQTVVAGLGNIYVDESLFASGLHPLQRSERLTLPQVERLHSAVRSILTRAIECQGSSFDAFYRTPEGQPGRFQDEFAVYGRDGRPCRACGATIERLVVGQRGTHVCPTCQPKPRAVKKRAPQSTPKVRAAHRS